MNSRRRCNTVVEEYGVPLKGCIVPENFRVITTASDGKTHIDAVLPCGVEAFTDRMEELVPGCRKSIEDFFAIGKECLDAGNYSLSVNGKTDNKYMMEHFPNFLKVGSYSVNKVFKALKMPALAQDIMNTYWGYLAIDADRLIVMSNGRIAADGSPAEVFSHVKEMEDEGLDVPETVRIVRDLNDCGFALPTDLLHTEECADAIAAAVLQRRAAWQS